MGVNHDIWPTPCSRPFGQQLSHVLWIRLLACEVRMPSDQVGFASMAGKWSRDPTVFESIEQGAAYPFLVPVAPPAGRAPLVPVEIDKRRVEQAGDLVGQGRLYDAPFGSSHRDDLGHGFDCRRAAGQSGTSTAMGVSRIIRYPIGPNLVLRYRVVEAERGFGFQYRCPHARQRAVDSPFVFAVDGFTGAG